MHISWRGWTLESPIHTVPQHRRGRRQEESYGDMGLPALTLLLLSPWSQPSLLKFLRYRWNTSCFLFRGTPLGMPYGLPSSQHKQPWPEGPQERNLSLHLTGSHSQCPGLQKPQRAFKLQTAEAWLSNLSCSESYLVGCCLQHKIWHLWFMVTVLFPLCCLLKGQITSHSGSFG